MKRILFFVLSLTSFLGFGQNADISRQINPMSSRIQADVSNQPLSTTLSGNVTISGVNTVDKLTYHTLNTSGSLFIGIDPINGDDSKAPSAYTVQTESFTGGVVFKSLDKAIEWINGSSGYSYYVSLRNTTPENPVVLSTDHEVINKSVILYSLAYPTPAHMTLNAGLYASTGTMLQLATLDLTLHGSNRLVVDGGDVIVQGCTIRPSVSCSNLYVITVGRMYLDNSTYVFSADNQSVLRPSGGYGAQVSVGMHGPLVFTMGSFTGLSLISEAHRGYNLSVKCKDNATFPPTLNIEGGLFQYGQTLVQGQAYFDPTNHNYKSVLYGPTPIRTPDMTSNSTDLTGSLKTVVVDENGRFGVLGNRFTTAQRDALTPYEGLEIYNLTTHTKEFWNGTTWKTMLTN